MSRSRAGARTPRATTGAATSSCAMSRAARCGGGGTDDREFGAAHLAVVEAEGGGEAEVEPAGARSLGGGGGVRTRMAVVAGRPFPTTAGAVLDPIFALRRRVRIPPGRTV